MGNIVQTAKREYQKHLERKNEKTLSQPILRSIPDQLQCQAPSDAPICFGAVGTGKVFDRWMRDMNRIPKDCRIGVKGVFDGSEALMRQKAQAHGISVCYDSYEALLADPEIHAVYVATPNYLHAEHAILALEAGKHVLCEKPIALSCDELERMQAAAGKNRVFLMEGMWMRTLPLMRTLQQVVGSGQIGEVRFLCAECCNSDDPKAFPALFRKETGGGALMDVGCYALHFAHLFFEGEPSLTASAALAETGVDLTSTITLTFPKGIAVLSQSLGSAGGANAVLHGSAGWIQIPRYLDSPSEFTVFRAKQPPLLYRYDQPREQRPIGYAYEILAFADAIRSGRLSCDRIPAEMTSMVAKETERARQICGLI